MSSVRHVLWSHPLACVLSDVLVMSAMWWSLVRHRLSLRSGSLRPATAQYVRPAKRKPPDPKHIFSFKEILGLDHRLLCETLCVYLALYFELSALRRVTNLALLFVIQASLGGAAVLVFGYGLRYLIHRLYKSLLYWNHCALATLLVLAAAWLPMPTEQQSLDPKTLRRKRQLAERKRKKGMSTLRKTLLLAMALPTIHCTADRAFATTLQAYRDPTGLLMTHDMPAKDLLSLRARLMSLTSEQQYTGLDNSGTFPIVIDSGASACSTPERKDFVEGTYEIVKGRNMSGIAQALPIVGRGLLRYEFVADDDKVLALETYGYHIPDLPIRLLSPQVHLRDGDTSPILIEYVMRADESRLVTADGRSITVPYNATTLLPIAYASLNLKASAETFVASFAGHVTDETNQNLSARQKTLLRWHQKLNHVGYSQVRWLARQGYLGHAAKAVASVLDKEVPLCATCLHSKQERLKSGATKKQQVPEKIRALVRDAVAPGDLVAIDQYVHTTPGRIPTLQGGSPQGQRYVGGTIFVDMASGYVAVHHQLSLNAHETLVSKAKYEQHARIANVRIKNYHGDNGIFNARAFTQRIWEQGQHITYSGVGAHHQNGAAERAIKTVTYMARSMLLHSAIRWPEVYSPEFWPFAMSYAAYVYNNVPKQPSGLSASELFTGVKEDHEARLQSILPWGIPAYVLDTKLQDGQSIPKWKPRSRRGQFLGISQYHNATNIGLIRNLVTQKISPQYHVVYDPWFETTYCGETEPPPNWDDLVIYNRFQCDMDFDLDGDYPLADEWLTSEERAARREEEVLRQRPTRPRQPTERQEPASRGRPFDPRNRSPDIDQGTQAPTAPPQVPTPQIVPPAQPEPAPDPPPRKTRVEPPPPAPDPATRRSSRSNRGNAPQKLSYDVLGGYAELMATYLGSSLDTLYYTQSLLIDPDEATVEAYLLGAPFFPWTLAAKQTRKGRDPDLPTWHQVMAGPHKEAFQKGMDHEINQLVKKDTWTEVRRSTLPAGANVIKSTWAFKIARLPDGSIKKFRSRFCARGDTQVEGVDVFETYSPVVAWSTVRMLLTLAVQLDLKTRAIDISNAFVSASLGPEEEIYIEMPRGYRKEDTVLKLRKSLYGLRQSPKMFFEHLKSSLESLGFQQSRNDQCMFMKDGIVAITYVDDILLFSKDADLIESTTDGLKSTFELTKDDPNQGVFDYLGIEIQRKTDAQGNRSICLQQLGLTKKILKTIKDGNLRPIIETKHKQELTPATKPLGACKDDEAFDEAKFGFSYPSAVGMLMYLVNTRPDCQFAVHQCARFTHSPKATHGKAIRRIARYLHDTMDEGLVLKTTEGPMRFDCYVDADFAGMYGFEDPQDPNSAKSRTGYVFTLGDNPIHWVSKLQSTIALSTVEAEYVALSQSLREFLPMRQTATEVCQAFQVDIGTTGEIKSTVFEDNNGALSIATAKRVNPRTKHIATVYHWFWDKTGEGTGIELKKIDTAEQLADIFTKPLDKETFGIIRKLLCGW